MCAVHYGNAQPSLTPRALLRFEQTHFTSSISIQNDLLYAIKGVERNRIPADEGFSDSCEWCLRSVRGSVSTRESIWQNNYTEVCMRSRYKRRVITFHKDREGSIPLGGVRCQRSDDLLF